jgi:NAD(P)-dependent dehydrogenase (short-subunit alcohol dehydrogenase family)
MITTLIAGAGKGLGYHAARRLLAHGYQVWVAARDPGRGAARPLAWLPLELT